MFVDFNILNQLGSPSINSNTFANRPAAGQTGRLFVSTDTFEIYRDNGTGWDLIGGPGSSTVTGSGAAGQVTYWTGTNTVSGENALFWDAANNRLGINTATPTAPLDVHSAADVAMQLNGTGATPTVLQQFLSAGVAQYELGYNWNASADYRRFSIYDTAGAKEVITIDQQSRYVGINFQYSSLTDQPQYMLDLSGGSFHTNVGQYLVGTPTDLTRSFAASGNANSIAVWLEEYGNTSASADVFFIKGRGTDTAKLNVQVGDSLGGLAFTGYLNAQYNNSVVIGTTITNLDTINNQANADFTIEQSFNSVGRTENFRIIANGGNADIRGSVTAASFIPDSSTIPANGLYLPAANTLGFATNSTERMRLDAFGNLGIGVTNMSSYNAGGNQFVIGGGAFNGLTIAGTIEGNIFFADGTIASETYRGTIGYNHTGDYLYFLSAALERMRITSGGNVLIGTTTDAGQKLQVNGNTNSAIEYKVGVYTQGDTTPSVLNVSAMSISNSSATTITNFTNGGPYQILVLKFNDSNTTIDRTNAYLSGGVNFTSTANDTLTLIQIGGFWYEVCRSVNS